MNSVAKAARSSRGRNKKKFRDNRVSVGKAYWTVLKRSNKKKIGKPLVPPEPFTDKLEELKPSPYIHAHSVPAVFGTNDYHNLRAGPVRKCGESDAFGER